MMSPVNQENSGCAKLLRYACPALTAVLFTGCSNEFQSALDPRGPQAESIAKLWWIILAASGLIFAAVILLLLWGIFRGKHRPSEERPVLSRKQGWQLVITAGVVFPVLILFAFLVYSVSIGRAITADPENPLIVEVVGHQWWWEVHYLAPDGQRLFTTANEIHIPVGRPVRFILKARDVIHSFWVPNLHGKTDMVPGLVNISWMQADQPGEYRGQCAEFCGLQHAKMAFWVFAQSPEDFAAWFENQRRPAIEPADDTLIRGQEVFLNSSCVLCHTIRGTMAFGKIAPELTHVGSRRTIGAATLSNTRGHMGGWLSDPQQIKPGNRMPPNQLQSDDFQALISYLESLK